MEKQYTLAYKINKTRVAITVKEKETEIFNFFIIDGYPKEDSLPNGFYFGEMKRFVKDRRGKEVPILKVKKFYDFILPINYEVRTDFLFSLFDIMPAKRQALEQVKDILKIIPFISDIESFLENLKLLFFEYYKIWIEPIDFERIFGDVLEYESEIDLEYLKKEQKIIMEKENENLSENKING